MAKNEVTAEDVRALAERFGVKLDAGAKPAESEGEGDASDVHALAKAVGLKGFGE